MTARKRTRRRLANQESFVSADRRPFPPKEAFDPLIDDQGFDSQQGRECQCLSRPSLTGDSASRAGNVPYEAEVAEVAGIREDRGSEWRVPPTFDLLVGQVVERLDSAQCIAVLSADRVAEITPDGR